MKKISNLNWTSIIVESILIVISILLALAINNYRDQKDQNQLRIDTINNISSELKSNSEELTELIQNHQTKYELIKKLLSSPNQIKLNEQSAIQVIGSLNNETLKRPALSSTAWETAKITNGLSLLDFKTIQKLTFVYSLQETSIEKVWEILGEYLLSKDVFDKEDVELNLRLFQTYIRELYKQEEYLKQRIEPLISDLEE